MVNVMIRFGIDHFEISVFLFVLGFAVGPLSGARCPSISSPSRLNPVQGHIKCATSTMWRTTGPTLLGGLLQLGRHGRRHLCPGGKGPRRHGVLDVPFSQPCLRAHMLQLARCHAHPRSRLYAQDVAQTCCQLIRLTLLLANWGCLPLS